MLNMKNQMKKHCSPDKILCYCMQFSSFNTKQKSLNEKKIASLTNKMYLLSALALPHGFLGGNGAFCFCPF